MEDTSAGTLNAGRPVNQNVEAPAMDRQGALGLRDQFERLVTRIYRAIHQLAGKAHLEALESEPGDLPESYGETRIVALPIDPYRIYVYWEVQDAETRRDVSEGCVQPTLRFCESAGAGTGECFDVDIDLRTRNWYVHLWSPEKSYTVVLGLRSEDGSFVELARSNTVRTPRAWPLAKAAGLPVPPTEVAPPPPKDSIAPQPDMREPVQTLQSGASSPDNAEPRVSGGPAEKRDEMRVRPYKPITSAEILTARLSELSALRKESRQPAGPTKPTVSPGPLSRGEETCQDVTDLSEKEFVSGVSSPWPGRDSAVKKASGT
jgi:hypothetical protein